MTKFIDERRSAPRFSLHLPLALKFSNGGVHGEDTFTRDVSSTGISFYADSHLKEGTLVDLTLSLPPGDLLMSPIRVSYKGKVVRVNALADGNFGVAAAIQAYEILPPA
jgi:PilZ domain